jgi:hypothetical protein
VTQVLAPSPAAAPREETPRRRRRVKCEFFRAFGFSGRRQVCLQTRDALHDLFLDLVEVVRKRRGRIQIVRGG